jgi:probable rRNA maturation factor
MRLKVERPEESRVELEVHRAVQAWAPSRQRIGDWARAARGARAPRGELAVRIVGRAEGRRLNARWRGRDYATNVLAFPAPSAAPAARAARAARAERRPLGDLVICAPVVAREAREQHKTLAAHWAHMVVHGTLHLAGYDHENDADARRMERRERRVLAGLGFADPYREPAGEAPAAPSVRRRVAA